LTKLDAQEKTVIDTVLEEIKKFEETQSKYKSYGAYDTESDGVFQRIIDRAVHGKNPDIPRTGDSWELYSTAMDCTEAANALHDQALKVVRAIESCPIRDLARLQTKIKDYCWRIY